MTVPVAVIQFARRLEAMQGEALGLFSDLIAQSEQTSGAEAIGLDALARELEQVGKVIGNYMPRIRKHVGELGPIADEPPSDISDLIRENEPFGEARDRLRQRYLDAQSRIADKGTSMPPPTTEDYVIFGRLFPHMGWLSKPGSVEIVNA